MSATEAGRLLAGRHAEGVEPDPDGSLLNYGERPHEGDWTLRSALVRLAQPQPSAVGSLLELMRRLDGPLHHVSRILHEHTVTCDRLLSVDRLSGPPSDPYPDTRSADLARLVEAGLSSADLLAGYQELAPLENEERMAVPLLAVALQFDGLASDLTAWALVGPANPPMDAVDRVLGDVAARLDELGVPVETGPPPGTRRSRG